VYPYQYGLHPQSTPPTISTGSPINHFSGVPGNIPGLSLLPILFYPGSFPFSIECSMRSRPKYSQAHIIHVKVVHMLAERWQHLSNQLIATLVKFLHLSRRISVYVSVVREQLCNQLFWPWTQCTRLFYRSWFPAFRRSESLCLSHTMPGYISISSQ